MKTPVMIGAAMPAKINGMPMTAPMSVRHKSAPIITSHTPTISPMPAPATPAAIEAAIITGQVPRVSELELVGLCFVMVCMGVGERVVIFNSLVEASIG